MTKKTKWTGPDQLKQLLVPISELVSDPKNTRRHDARNLEAISACVTVFGQMRAIVVRKQDKVVVAGNGLLEVLKQLKWTHAAAIVVPMTDQQARAYSIADNRTAELASWDFAELSDALGDPSMGSMLDVVGFSSAEIDEMISRANAADGDALPARKREVSFTATEKDEDLDEDELELPRVATAKPGDVWVCGDHQVLCMDPFGAPARAWAECEKASAIVTLRVGQPDVRHDQVTPVKLLQQLIEKATDEGDLVADPFGGFGATLIAAQKCGRRARVIEADPKFVDVIVARWERTTGRKAQLLSNGRGKRSAPKNGNHKSRRKA